MHLRLVIICLLSFMVTYSLQCQDYISINNDKKIKVKILEISSSYIVYELWQDDGIKYRVNRAELTDVVFDNTMDVLFVESYPTFTNSNVILKSKTHKNYLVGEEWVGSFWSLESEFSKSSEAAMYFFKAKRQKKSARILGISSLVLMGGGLALAYDSYFYDIRFAVGAVSFFFIGPGLGTAGIISKISSINNKNRAEKAYGIQYVNQAMTRPYEDLASLHFGVTNNGVGLVLQF